AAAGRQRSRRGGGLLASDGVPADGGVRGRAHVWTSGGRASAIPADATDGLRGFTAHVAAIELGCLFAGATLRAIPVRRDRSRAGIEVPSAGRVRANVSLHVPRSVR